jgi:SAM-dependent methyltransferase
VTSASPGTLLSSVMTEPDHLSMTRTAYDTVAVDYAEALGTVLAGKPWDRAVFAAFAEMVPDGAPVADLGCGPGHVTAHLRSLGLASFGVDLSPSMIAVARAAYPELRFDEGSMLNLELADGELGGIVAFYSIIHTPTELLPDLFTEFHRVLAPDGQLLLGFQVGDERITLEKSHGHQVTLDVYRRQPETVARLLGAAGLTVHTRQIREPDESERTQQAMVLAHRSPATSLDVGTQRVDPRREVSG